MKFRILSKTSAETVSPMGMTGVVTCKDEETFQATVNYWYHIGWERIHEGEEE